MKLPVKDIQPNARPVPGYNGYFLDDDSNIYSTNGRWNKNLTPLRKARDKSGYEIITLCKNGRHYTKTIHRLMTETFLGYSSLDINHKDGNKANNQLSNLEYCTKSQNIRHAIQAGLLRPNTKAIAYDKRKVVGQYKGNLLVRTYESAHEAAKLTGFSRGNISTSCRLGKPMYGFRWSYWP